eukprot:13322236-Alexandrium_andersonii.AAC.1
MRAASEGARRCNAGCEGGNPWGACAQRPTMKRQRLSGGPTGTTLWGAKALRLPHPALDCFETAQSSSK